MPFMTYNLKKIVATEDVKAAVCGFLAKKFTTPVDTSIRIHDVFLTASNSVDDELDKHISGGLVVIISAHHSKYHAAGHPHYFNVMNATVKEVLDLDNLTYTGDSYRARQDDKLRIYNLDLVDSFAEYTRFNYSGFNVRTSDAQRSIDPIIDRMLRSNTK